jgi:hypothetical protein
MWVLDGIADILVLAPIVLFVVLFLGQILFDKKKN